MTKTFHIASILAVFFACCLGWVVIVWFALSFYTMEKQKECILYGIDPEVCRTIITIDRT